ncbi:MAG TPA: acetylornithine transaminase [Actinomycetes bacterium]|nr:acetylornithine transaminase [Actinomycetes bacterium]
MLPTYAAPVLTLVRGEGATVWDDQGRSYVDLVAGIAVNALGHAHPAVVEAVSRQVSTLGHTSNLVATEPSLRLAERLLALAGRPGEGRVFFANSGAEANEAAFKLARRTGRGSVVSAEGGFHGRTMGALALTGQPAKRAPFEPLPDGVTFVPYGDLPALTSAVGPHTAAVLLEPVQGEAGVVVPPAGYLRVAREVTRRHGALLVLDEVQTGIGRTGAWFAHQHEPAVDPDVVTLAKGLGGGLPIGALLAFGAAADLIQPGQHGSTFGGNPVSCAAALAVLDTIESEGLLTRATVLGERLRTGVATSGHPLVVGVRGAGLMLAVELGRPVAAAAEAAARDAGFLVNAVGPSTIRLVPPLVLTDEQADAFLAALPGVLDTAVAARSVPATASTREDA